MIDCIDKNLAQDQIEERIHKFIYRRMDEDELTEFISHLHECKACDKEADVMAEISRGFELYFSHEKLKEMFKDRDYLGMLRLGERKNLKRERTYRIEGSIRLARQEFSDGVIIYTGLTGDEKKVVKEDTKKFRFEVLFANDLGHAKDMLSLINLKMKAAVFPIGSFTEYVPISGMACISGLEIRRDVNMIVAVSAIPKVEVPITNIIEDSKKDNVVYLENPEEIKEFMKEIEYKFAA